MSKVVRGINKDWAAVSFCVFIAPMTMVLLPLAPVGLIWGLVLLLKGVSFFESVEIDNNGSN